MTHYSAQQAYLAAHNAWQAAGGQSYGWRTADDTGDVYSCWRLRLTAGEACRHTEMVETYRTRRT